MKLCKSAVSVLLLFCLLCSLVSCEKAPALDSVRDTFRALIEASAEVNDIFFGQGLPVYDRAEASGDGNMTFDEKTGFYYIVLEDSTYGSVLKYYDKEQKKNVYAAVLEMVPAIGDAPEEGLYFADGGTVFLNRGGAVSAYRVLSDYQETEKEYVYDEKSPVYYDYVRLDCPYQTVASIQKKAESVYSAAYLESVYVILFDGLLLDGQVIYARYMPDESGETQFLLKSNRFDPYFETQTVYDYSTMKIISPSGPTSVNVEIEGEGTVIDFETASVTRGKVKKVLRFVLESGEWRLDTPTY